MAKKNTAQAPLTPAVLHILLALSTGERHGYGIMKQVQADSQGKAKMGPGTLYGSMGRMMEAGLIRESDKRVDPEMDDERRIYYELTGAGRAALEAELKRYRGVVAVAEGRLAHGCTNVAGRRYRTWYAMLLRLYPRPFRERFGAGMAQTFHDLCREYKDARRGLFGLALRIFFETSAGIVRENTTHMSQLGKTMLRVALGALAALMAPLAASQFVEDWHWGVGGFAGAYVLFFVTGMAYAAIARRMGAWSYKAGVGVALVAGLALGWSTMVQVADSGHPERLWYHSVLVVGAIGACLARLKAPGLAWTLFAMAATLALIAVTLPSAAPPDMARRMAIGHGVFVALFTASGLLFRQASLAGLK